MIELPFGVENGIGPGIGALDGVHLPQEGRFWDFSLNGVFECIFKTEKCIRLVREKLTIFPYGQ